MPDLADIQARILNGCDPPPRIYLAMPMTPVADCEFASQVEGRLRKGGWVVLSPASSGLCACNYGIPKSVWLEQDFWMLSWCTAICLLPGWETSEGAQAELALARELHLEEYVWDPELGLTPLETNYV